MEIVIGLIFPLTVILIFSGSLYYILMIKPEREERKKHSG